MVHALNKFRHYITSYEIFVHTNHSALRYLINNHITNGGITRWLSLMQEFNITVLDRPGRENQVAYFLSRLNNSGEVVPISDNFPDEQAYYLFLL